MTSVDGELVSFRWTNVFESDGATLVSESTLRFRHRVDIERSLAASGYEVVDVRQAPDRPGNEMVFVVRKPVSVCWDPEQIDNDVIQAPNHP